MRALTNVAVAATLSLSPPAYAQTQPGALAGSAPAPDYSRGGQLVEVARFAQQEASGVAVSRQGRIFVAMPRWTLDVPVSVGEVKDGQIVPFPDAAWNAYRNTSPVGDRVGAQFVCAMTVVFDHGDNLWVLDPAAPAQSGPVAGGPKLVEIDLRTNTVARVLPVGGAGAPPGSYLNDVRFSPDDRWAYLTDSGVVGALVVIDLQSGRAHRVLDGDPSTQLDKTVVVEADGKPVRGLDGRGPQFAADGIALSADGQTLYWQALVGKTLYSVPTAALQDPAQAGQVRPTKVADTHVADGFWIDAANHLYITNPAQNSIEVMAFPDTTLRLLVKDVRLRWPDTFGQASDGTLYITASHIQDSPTFNRGATTTPSAIFKIVGGSGG